MSSQSSDAAAVKPAASFTGYEKFVIALLAFLQFTVVLDFMILAPLGAILLKELNSTTGQFGLVVSGYAFAAGASGLMAAGFADRFDRKRLLLFFYTGFIIGTLLCALATSYPLLLAARIFTGFFGGVIGSISMAIVADVFPVERRGRVMGFVQNAFAGAQVLGLPAGLWLATRYGWHSGFFMIVGVSTVVGALIVAFLKPINAHLAAMTKRHPLTHLWKTAVQPRYTFGFLATMLLATGGYMLTPFSSTFSVNNLGLTMDQVSHVYIVTGIVSMIVGPLLGRVSDSIGKYRLLVISTLLGMATILVYTRLQVTPVWMVILVSVVLYSTISGRIVSASALNSAMPDLSDRGAYMSISSSLQQLSGGVGSWVAGLVVVQLPSGKLEHYPTLGIIVACSMLSCVILMYQVHRIVSAKQKAVAVVPEGPFPEPLPAAEAIESH